jgi:G3E family GTPase
MSTSTLIPVHILTGFLGSGKTTLLNHALQSGLGPETAVIVNEFGAVGLDQLFVQSHSEETVVLKSGCVCCTIRTDLASTLLQVLAMRTRTDPPLRRILIETSGVSDPLPILQTLRSEFNLLTRFRAGPVVCAVGATDDTQAHHRPEALAQITAADGIVITKRDLVGPEAARAMQAAVIALNPLAEIVPGTGADFVTWLVGNENVVGNPLRAVRKASRSPMTEAHTHGVRSIVIRTAAAPSWSKFAIWLTRLVFLHGDRILRTKGVLFDPERQAWIGVHGVKRFFHPPVHLTLPVPPADGACLVFITEHLDPALIAGSYKRMAKESEAFPDRHDVPRDSALV